MLSLILPRLILADEYRSGKVPSGVLVAGALKELGYKLKLFMGNTDEVTMRALQVVTNQPVTLLDPVLCGWQPNLRWLFESAASPDCVNLILVNLGGRILEDAPFKVPKECALLSEWLDCDVIPVIYSDASSTLTVRSVAEAIRQIEGEGKPVRSILFRSILNNREYELVDREAGRNFTVFSAGSLPRVAERDLPSLVHLCSDQFAHAALPLRSAAKQLAGMKHLVNWAIFSAIAKAAPAWRRQSRLSEPITDSGKVNIAVVRHQALSIAGDGTEHLLRALGCNVVDIPLEGGISHSVPIHGVYLPHGLAYMALPKFFSNIYLKTMLTRGSSGESFLFAEGGSSSILGDKIILPDGRGEGRGFGILPFSGIYKKSTFGSAKKMQAVGRAENPFLSGAKESVFGYGSDAYSLIRLGEEDECWVISDVLDPKKTSLDGWCKKRILATAMRVEPWSAPDMFRRWLEG
jgi:cobyrinic acid a,c-diamide synthase